MPLIKSSEKIRRTGKMGTTIVHESYQQPLHNWLAAKIYHWWDMRVFKVPGFKALERYLMQRHNRNCEGCSVGFMRDGTKIPVCSYIPLSNRQDIRCFELSRKNRITLGEQFAKE